MILSGLVLYLIVGFFIGVRLGTIRAWTLLLREKPNATEMTSAAWWKEPDPFFISLGGVIAWPVLLVIWVLLTPVSRIMFQPPPEVRKRIEAERIAALERELDL